MVPTAVSPEFMPMEPDVTTRMSDVLLLIGVVLFAGGLAVLAGGLRALESPPPFAASPARPGWTLGRDAETREPSLSIGRATEDTMWPTADVPRSRPEPGRSEASLLANNPGSHDGAAMGRATARWSGDRCFAAMVIGDRGQYLAQMANARLFAHWRQVVTEWEDVSGSGVVEANRAMRGQEAPNAATLPTDRGGRQPSLWPPEREVQRCPPSAN